MSKEKNKVPLFTRVSTNTDRGVYSLEAQKSRMKAFAIYNDYEIVRVFRCLEVWGVY